MADSFPGSPDSSGASFPQGSEATDQNGPGALPPDREVVLFQRYRVIRELGRGGMGVVFLAHDTALGVEVAIKLVPQLVVQDSEAIADLRKEVLRGMALTHAGIVRTHTFERDDTSAGIVMEYVDGETLSDLKRRQPSGCFDVEQLLPWLEQLCPALDYAHQEAHIVHRDLKPRNLMVTQAGKLKVADFGIAATLGETMGRHSMEGKVSGTPSYMSPEQAQGKRPSHLDDIHALGATLYELITGRAPFYSGGLTTIIAQVINAVPPSMTARRVELKVTGKAPIPNVWEEVIAACLAKDPADRPQSAGEVLARLQGRAAVPSSRSRAWLAWAAAATVIAGGAAFALRRPAPVAMPAPITGVAAVSTPAASTPRSIPLVKPTEATKSAPFVNSLGQPFVRAGTGDVLFCTWETRVQDFAEFFTHSRYDMTKGSKPWTMTPDGWKQIGGNWRKPYFKPMQAENHPVVCVSWDDAKAFCEWLTQRERGSGSIPPGMRYRLPSDAEWSVAAGLGDRETRGGTPASKDGKLPGLYSWGTAWPPPKRIGNIAGADVEFLKPGVQAALQGYTDGFRHTSPVGSFTANDYGLWDLDGNVHEWCADYYQPGKPERVYRGPSWATGHREGLLLSNRYSALPDFCRSSLGFRIVLSLSGH